MKHLFDYKHLALAIIVYLFAPVLVHADKPTAERGPLPPSVREGVPIKRVPLATKDIGLNLVGTVVADDPEMSVAVLYKKSTRKQGI